MGRMATSGSPAQGSPGAAAGFGSPTASATTLSPESSATVTVTASGPDTGKVFSFVFGIPRGANGNTPRKGIDYWTESDKQNIVQETLNALPKWGGGSY